MVGPKPLFVSELEACPCCGAAWKYETGGRRYSAIIALVRHDRVASWKCPDCKATWPRGAVAKASES